MDRLRRVSIGGHLRQHWRRVGLYGVGTVIGLLIVAQLVFPWNSLPLYATIDGIAVGGKSASEATSLLNDRYKKQAIDLYFGNNPKPYRQPVPADIGLTVDSKPQVDAAAYPLWLRLVPTSLWWAHTVLPPAAPSYKHDMAKAEAYVKKELGKSCKVEAENATLAYKDNKLQVVPAIDGGTCNLEDVQKLLANVTPRLADPKVRVAMDQHPAKIHDDAAQDFAGRVMDRTKDVTIEAGDETVKVPQHELLTWLDFDAPDSGLTAKVNAGRAADFLTKQVTPKVSIKAGISYVKTLDFTVVSQVFGTTGQTLDTGAMIKQLNKHLDGDTAPLSAPTKPVEPSVKYTRTYSATDTGLSALITHFAQSHSGDFGVSFIEITGSNHRRATYQDTKQFRTASTYKLFVAYSTLKRVEQGKWHWTDQIQGGRNLDKCLTDMIVVSDNACGEALLYKIGFQTITNEIHDIGLSRSSFMGKYIMTTAGDLTAFVGSLYSGHLLSKSSTDKLIGLMKRNVYRQGIPAGAKGTVADKVGFLEDYLNDAAIVYSPSGTYALSIMTKGSSWGTIAELTRQIEKWRTQ